MPWRYGEGKSFLENWRCFAKFKCKMCVVDKMCTGDIY